MRSTGGSQSDKSKRRPKAAPAMAFGNAGIEPSLNKARQASISQMHVFKEARTQAKAPAVKSKKQSSSSLLMSSFLKGGAGGGAAAAATREATTTKQSGGKRGREVDVSSIHQLTQRGMKDSGAAGTSSRQKNENILNRPSAAKDTRKAQTIASASIDDMDDDAFDLDKIVDDSYCEHQRKYKKQQLQLVQLQMERSGRGTENAPPHSSSSLSLSSSSEVMQFQQLSQVSHDEGGDTQDHELETEGHLEPARSRKSKRTTEQDETEEAALVQDVIAKVEAGEGRSSKDTARPGMEGTVADLLVKRTRTSKEDSEKRVQWRPHSFVRDPRQYSRYPMSHFNAPFVQNMFDRVTLKRMGVQNPSTSMPRRVTYCGNMEVNPRHGVNRIIFDPCGTHYAVCGSNGMVRIHDFDVSEANLLHGRSASEEAGGPNDCLWCSVNTKRSVADLAWSNRDSEDVIAVVFTTSPEIWIYDLQNIRARSEPNLKIKCQDGGNRVVLFDAPSGEKSDEEDYIIAGSSTGVIRKFSIPRPNGELALNKYSKRWEVHADPQKKTERAGVAGLVYPLPRTTSRFRVQKDHDLDHDDVLISVTERGAISLWDTRNMVTANFGSSGQPQALATLNAKASLNMSLRSDTVVGIECVDMSLGRSGVKESSWQPSRWCACVVAVSFSTGSVYFFDLSFMTTAERKKEFIERSDAKTEARKSNFAGGMNSTTNAASQPKQQQEKASQNSIRTSSTYGHVVAVPKFTPPSTNLGASIQLNGALLQEITEERVVAQQVLRNNKFNTPPCVTRWARNSLQVFSSFPHFHADLQNPLHYIVATELSGNDSGTVVQDDKNRGTMMKRTGHFSFSMPGHVVEAIPGQKEITVSADLRPFFAGHTVGPDTGGSTGARIQLDSTGRSGPQRVHAVMSGKQVTGYAEAAPTPEDHSSRVTSYHLHWAESRSVFLSSPYMGPPIRASAPFTSIKSTLEPWGRPSRTQQARKSQFQTDIALRQAPATAMAAHPFLPFIVIGDKDDNVRILSAATVDSTVPVKEKGGAKEKKEEDVKAEEPSDPAAGDRGV